MASSMTPLQGRLLKSAADALARVREQKPLVMCLTNTVVTNWTANCLLALGATPAMVEEPEEAAELAASSGAVLVNVGTVTHSQAAAMRDAIASCNAHGVPWVLDPVAVDKLAFRRDLVGEFLREKPRMVRGNAREIASLGSRLDGIVTLATDKIDAIGDIRIANGVPMLQRVTGTGCAQGALAAAFCAVESNAMVAAVAASLAMALAGEAAYGHAKRPGSFQIALLDALDALTPEEMIENARFA